MTNSQQIGIAILGGTGFGAGELLRLLINHPAAEVTQVVSSSASDETLDFAHPHLASFYPGLSFTSGFDPEKLSPFTRKVVFSAIPHGESSKTIAPLIASNSDTHFIDLSGDLRLKDEAAHRNAYPHSTTFPELQRTFAYGLPELFSEEIRASKHVANPGCLATAAILSFAPLKSLSPINIIFNLATGSSGAGKEPKASTHHPVRHANFFSYKPLTHQHMPEIAQALELTEPFAFVPHSLPVSRGILATTYATLREDSTTEEISTLFENFYRDSPFVRVRKNGSCELENVVGSNFCDISITVDKRQVVINAAIDNLVKGMAGQAIQNMNLLLGIPQKTGLFFPALRPI